MMGAATKLRATAEAGNARAATLVVDGVTKRFATPDGTISALEDVSFSVKEGEFLALIGPSGCGKSTLFNIVGGLLGEYDGRVLVDGKVITGSHREIGMVFQEESIFPWRTTLDNVAFPLEVAGAPKAERHARATELIKLVGLDGFENRYPAEMSGGMRQRTAIARTLAFQPKILLMDEPFAALDEQTRLLLGDKVLHIQQTLRQTTLLITHNIAEAVQLADRVVVMTYRPGRVKRIFDIDLPRPRTSEIVGSAEFGQYVAKIWNDLREEASKGLSDSEASVVRRPSHH
jgi:NitT/TauT family transport system ATP-binding protein